MPGHAAQLALHGAVFLAGVAIVAGTLASATRTFVLPRGASDRFARTVFRATWLIFRLRLSRARTYLDRDRVLAPYAPLSLMMLLPAWLMAVLIGYMAMFWAAGVSSLRQAFVLSGSSLLTLGFAGAGRLGHTVLVFTEAMIGLILVALLIAYLPTMYAAFARREAAVALLEVRAGSPPSAVEMIARSHRLGRMDRMPELWSAWEVWFADIEESHTSLAALAFFRSPQPDRSWITAAGAVLDCAALTASTLDVPRDVQAELCIRAGYVALRRIADFFRIPYDPDPRPDDSISIARSEFEEVCERLIGYNVPLKDDRDQAWRDFSGWRVNYDTVLLGLAQLTVAPYAPWISDRSLRRRPGE